MWVIFWHLRRIIGIQSLPLQITCMVTTDLLDLHVLERSFEGRSHSLLNLKLLQAFRVFFPPAAEFSKVNELKYFAGGDSLLSRLIPLHKKYTEKGVRRKESENEKRRIKDHEQYF